ncbi:class E sortase [Candidatus Daviesbacteria bacterium]|nr:class E sortase [Candidatus Daviesbacteria bacterium]
MQFFLPLASFQIWEISQNVNNQTLISPKNANSVLGISVQNKDNFPTFISSRIREIQPSYNIFTLSVPKLKIEKNNVFVDSNDLAKGLVHLPGSALPGEKGNIFISGHSALSRFFAGQNAPFGKLPELKKGDEIIIEAANNKYVYKVIETKAVSPSDLSVIPAPDTQGRYISLMTCVPPGLNLKRLIVLGKMI